MLMDSRSSICECPMQCHGHYACCPSISANTPVCRKALVSRSPSAELLLFCRHPTIRKLTQKAFDWRLRAVPYHYTAFHDAHLNGCSVMRPLFFSWPTDTATFLIDRQWMLGDAIMIAPILLESTNTVPAYFPAGTWYDLYNHTSIDTSTTAQHLPVTVSSVLSHSNALRCSI